MTLIAYVFPKLSTPKCVVREMSKNSSLRGAIDRRHGKPDETLIQSFNASSFTIFIVQCEGN